MISSLSISWHRSTSTLAQSMACCLTAPSHYLNQCWLLISEVLWHSLPSILTAPAQSCYYKFENYTFKIFATSPRVPSIKDMPIIHEVVMSGCQALLPLHLHFGWLHWNHCRLACLSFIILQFQWILKAFERIWEKKHLALAWINLSVSASCKTSLW